MSIIMRACSTLAALFAPHSIEDAVCKELGTVRFTVLHAATTLREDDSMLGSGSLGRKKFVKPLLRTSLVVQIEDLKTPRSETT